MGCRPQARRPSLPWCFGPAGWDRSQLQDDASKLEARNTVPSPDLRKKKASCKNRQASWQLAVQEGKQIEGLKLLSSQFRKQRLAVWAAGRGPDPSFTAMVWNGPGDGSTRLILGFAIWIHLTM